MHDKLILSAQKSKYSFCSCVCLLVKGLTSHSRLFHSYGDAPISVAGLQILTYTRHSWPLSIEGPLVCHTNCDTEHPLKMVIFDYHDIYTCCRAFCSGAVTTFFYDLGLLWLGFELPTIRIRSNRSYRLRHGGCRFVKD